MELGCNLKTVLIQVRAESPVVSSAAEEQRVLIEP